MANRVTHIYRVDIGCQNKVDETVWVYSPNAKFAKEYCKQNFFQDRKYDHYHAVMVGETKTPLPPIPVVTPLSPEEVEQISSTPAKDGEYFVEHRFGVPRL